MTLGLLNACAGFDAAKGNPTQASAASLEAASTSPVVGSIRATVLGTPLVISATARNAGAIDSLIWNGLEFIDAKDHGRELQSASSYDGYGECLNPTEAGSGRDGVGATSTSRLLGLSTDGNVLATTTQMAYWVPAGARYDGAAHCGTHPELHAAVNGADLSNDLVSKSVSIGYGGFDNVIQYLSSFRTADAHSQAQFEAVTGYLSANFTSFYAVDMNTYAMRPLDHVAGEVGQPVIFATADGSHAMGAYSPDIPENATSGYAKFFFPGDTSKWSVVFRQNATPAGTYAFRSYIVVGNLTQVRATLTQLDRQFRPGKGATPATAPAGFFTLDGRGIYYSNGSDAYCQIPNPTVFTAMGGDANLNNVATWPTAPGAMRADGTCGQAPTLAAAAPPTPTAPMHRFYNAGAGDHFFTASYAEGAASGYTYEGVGFNFVAAAAPGTHPLYRCLAGSVHFTSTDPGCEGQAFEGQYGLLWDAPAYDRAALYRLFNPKTGDHLSTVRADEGAALGYVIEGVQGYVN